MNREQLRDKIEKAWGEFNAAWAGLPEAAMLAPGVVGDWSVKDVLAHVTTWEEEALKYLPLIAEGRRSPRYKDLYGGLDSFNDQVTARKRELSLAEVLAQFEAIHRELLDYLATAPDNLIVCETPFRRRVRLDTYSHYPIHTAAIREWRCSEVSRSGHLF